MTEIKGKWALVTGASRGIGALAAKFLAEKPAGLYDMNSVMSFE